MDLAYWGFQRWPFDRSFVADRFFASPVHEEALARLMFLVEEFRRSGILMGPAGTGKTYLLKLLQNCAERMGRITVRCEATGLDGDELVRQIAIGIQAHCHDESRPSQVWSGLQVRFRALTLIQQPLVVIVDHFDLAERNRQQAICRLRQLADSVGLKLTLILATRDNNVSESLQDAIELRIEIGPWTIEETSMFVNNSVVEAGGSESLFTNEALASIHESTGGIPANIVALCSLTLLAAMCQEAKLVTQELVEAATNELPRGRSQLKRVA